MPPEVTLSDLIHAIGLAEGWGVESSDNGPAMIRYNSRTIAPFGLLGDSERFPDLRRDPQKALDFMRFKLTNPSSATYVPGLVRDDDSVDVSLLPKLRDRWAPLGANNDPSNLNSNWLRNVSTGLGMPHVANAVMAKAPMTAEELLYNVPSTLPYELPQTPEEVDANLAYVKAQQPPPQTAPVEPEQAPQPIQPAYTPPQVTPYTGGFAPPFIREHDAPAPQISSTAVAAPQVADLIKQGRVQQAQQAVRSGQIEQSDIQPTDDKRAYTDTPGRSLADDAYANEYYLNDIGNKGVPLEQYIAERKRLDVLNLLQQRGTAGKALSLLIGPMVDPAADFMKRTATKAVNSLLGGIPVAVVPEDMKLIEQSLDSGPAANAVADLLGEVGGFIGGLKGTKSILKAAVPAFSKVAPGIQEALTAATYETPKAAIDVAEGRKTVGEAAKDVAITTAELGLMEPLSKVAKGLTSSVSMSPVGAKLYEAVANAALQTEAVGMGEYIRTGQIDPKQLATNILLTTSGIFHGEPAKAEGGQIDVSAESIPDISQAEGAIGTPRIDAGESAPQFPTSAEQIISEPNATEAGREIAPIEQPSEEVVTQEPTIERTNDNAIEDTNGVEERTPTNDLGEYQRATSGQDLRPDEAQIREGDSEQTSSSNRPVGEPQEEVVPVESPSTEAPQPQLIESAVAELPKEKGIIKAPVKIGVNTKLSYEEAKFYVENIRDFSTKPDLNLKRLTEAQQNEVNDIYLERKRAWNTNKLNQKIAEYPELTDLRIERGWKFDYEPYEIPVRTEEIRHVIAKHGDALLNIYENNSSLPRSELPASVVLQIASDPEFQRIVTKVRPARKVLEGGKLVEGQEPTAEFLSTSQDMAAILRRKAPGFVDAIDKETSAPIPGIELTPTGIGNVTDVGAFVDRMRFKNPTSEAPGMTALRSAQEGLQLPEFQEPRIEEDDTQAHFGGEQDFRQEPFTEPVGDRTSPVDREPQKFEEGQKVYTYLKNDEGLFSLTPRVGKIVTKERVVKDGNGKIVRDADGNVVKEQAQFINDGKNPLIPVDENTRTFGTPHEITSAARNEQSPSTFIVGKLQDEIAKSLGYSPGDLYLTNRTMGLAKNLGTNFRIGLGYNIFADPNLASEVISHEMGHVIDMAGKDVTLGRGNLLGHIFALRDYVKSDILNLGDKDIRTELINLSREWHPYESTNPDYISARTSSKELIADAIGAMLNRPDLVEAKAPKFAQQFSSVLNSRPAVEEAYNTLRSALQGDPTVVGPLALDAIESGFTKAEESRIANRNEEQATVDKYKPTIGKKLRSAFNSFAPADFIALKASRLADKTLKDAGVDWKTHQDFTKATNDKDFATAQLILDKLTPEQQTAMSKASRLMGSGLQWPELLTITQRARTTSDQQNAMTQHLHNEFYKPLQEAGVSQDQFGQYLVATAVKGDYRAGIANPYLIDEKAADAMLSTLRQQLEPGAFETMTQKAEGYRAYGLDLVRQLYDAGALSEETMSQVLRNKDSYARFASALKAADRVQFTREAARGTVHDIQNPTISMGLQFLDLQRKINYQNLTRSLVETLGELGDPPKVIEEGQRAPRGTDLIRYFDKGKVVEVAVDPWFADMYTHLPNVFQGRFAQALNFVKNFQRNILIEFNPTFQSRNVPKDLMQTYALNGTQFLKEYAQSFKTAKAAQRGSASNEASRAYDRGVVREFNVSSRYELEADPYKRLLEVTGINEPAKLSGPSRLKKGLTKLLGSDLWETLEATPHLSVRADLIKRGFSEGEADYISSTLAGTPDTRIRGKFWTQATSIPFLFANVQIQGLLRSLRVARNPRTNAGFFMRQALLAVPKAAIWGIKYGAASAAAAALWGDDDSRTRNIRKWQQSFAYIPDYFMKSYYAVPIGLSQRAGKSVADIVAFPEEENTQMAMGIIDPMLKAIAERHSNLSDLVQETGNGLENIFPSLSPTAKTTAMLYSYFIQGQNPYDDFYGTYILKDREYKIAKDDKFDPIPSKVLGQNILRNILGTQFRQIEGWVDQSRPFELPFYVRQTRGGIDEAVQKAIQSSDADKARDEIRRSKLLGEGEDAINSAYDREEITDKQRRSMLRKLQSQQGYSPVSHIGTQLLEEMKDEGVGTADEELGARIESELSKRERRR